MSKRFVAVAALLGTIVGAGYLGIPYVVSKSGFSLGLVHFAIIALAILISLLYLGEIVLRTKSLHQLPGYAEKYLGKKGRILMMLSVFFGVYSALIAYLIAESNSLSYLIFGDTGNSFYLGLGFWAVFSFIAYFGQKAYEKEEYYGSTLAIISLLIIVILYFSSIRIENLSYISYESSLAPFGVILFAFLGFTAVPELAIILKNDKKKLRSSVIIGIGIIFILYILFTAVVLGMKGTNTPEIATFALGAPFILLGMLTMFNSYIAHSMALMDTFKLDFSLSKKVSWLLTVLIPMALFALLSIFNKASFISILGIGGVISGGTTIIMIFLILKKAKKRSQRKPEYSIPAPSALLWILALLFIIGAVMEILR